MFGIFKKDPAANLEKLYKAKLTEAMNAQRKGDIQSYAKFTSEAEELLEKINNLNDKP